MQSQSLIIPLIIFLVISNLVDLSRAASTSVASSTLTSNPEEPDAYAVTQTNALVVSGPKTATAVEHEPEKPFDPYEYRYIFAEGVQNALDECRQRFKWDRWNCPKKLFLDILARNQLPSNRELAYLRALISSSVVLSLARSCSYGPNKAGCGCRAHLASPPATSLTNRSLMANQPENDTSTKFAWQGCEESIKMAFEVSKVYLDTLNSLDSNSTSDQVIERINARNFEAGRVAVRKNIHKICKCHGVSGSCQVKHCWSGVPSLSQVGAYLRRQYNYAAKVGSTNTDETELSSLETELSHLSPDKLVFADPSPDYCYENSQLGVDGTLGRYCSRSRFGPDGREVSKSERDSCDRLCTKCGYKVKREVIQVEKQCDCRFVFCCKVECKRCPQSEMTYKCIRHS